MRRVRRRIGRAFWAARLLRLPISHAAPATSKRGIIMIQIDGLAFSQFEKARQADRLKFLSRLLTRGEMELREFYSGLPSTTPAVQGEIFYGKRCAVPAFEYLDKNSGEIFRMFDPMPAEVVEKKLQESAGSILEGGRAYSDIYWGNAQETHYCSRDLARKEMWKMIFNPRWIIIGLFHFVKLVRMFLLALLEVGLALYDFLKGLLRGENLVRELLTIPARAFIGIMLREYIRFRVLLDIEEGARVIHANFLGYDEQSHRRGPSSKFAHWSLAGIDRAIRDMYLAARRSDARDYEFLIYSDHGQEETDPYEKRCGRLLEEDLAHALVAGPWQHCRVVPASEGKRAAGESGLKTARKRDSTEGEILVAAMGPLGHVYFPCAIDGAERERCARDIIAKTGVPLVLWQDGENIYACHARGVVPLPEKLSEILGEHPFRAEIEQDLMALVRHPDAGELVLSGWTPHGKPLSFPPENGAHAGPGPEETRGFLLVPESLCHEEAITKPGGTPIRGENLHRLVHEFLAEKRPVSKYRRQETRPPNRLRVMTYNIHSCVGLDGRLRPERVARAINRFHPDIIAVQEVDAHRPRTGKSHQAEWIAEHLEMRHVFHSMLEHEEEKYGIAVFSSLPFEMIRADLLTPSGGKSPLTEARGAIWLKLAFGGRSVHFLNTHFGLGSDERNRQTSELLSEKWIGGIPENEPVILCGDFNSSPRSVAWKRLDARLRDSGPPPGQTKRSATFPSIRPVFSLDHIFTSPHFRTVHVMVPRDFPVAIASDHLPLVVDLEWREPE